MDDNLFLEHFFKKISQLEKIAKEKDRQAIIDAITKLKNYCISDSSVQELRCFQAFYSYVFSTCQNDYNDDRNQFMIFLKIKANHCSYQTWKQDGELYTILIPKTISLSGCTGKDRRIFFDKTKDIILDKYNINFDDWFNHWNNNENTI